MVRSQHGPRRLRPLRPARRPRALPAGPARPTRSPTRRSRRSRCLRIGLGDAGRRHRHARGALRPVAIGGVVDRRRLRRRPSARAAIDAFRAAARHRRADRARRRLGRLVAQDRAGRAPQPPADEPAPRSPAAELAPSSAAARRAPLAPPAPPAVTKDLSVVVVFYNMKREAQRTLHSLSRAYQQGIDGLDYEVDRRRERLGARPEARRGVRAQLRAGVPLPRPRRRRDTDPGRRAQPRPRARGRATRSCS